MVSSDGYVDSLGFALGFYPSTGGLPTAAFLVSIAAGSTYGDFGFAHMGVQNGGATITVTATISDGVDTMSKKATLDLD
jgi:hypothetical protein